MESAEPGMNQKGEMIKELIQGIEVAKKLHQQFLSGNIIDKNGDAKHENQKDLIDKMLSSFDKTISMAKLMMGVHQQVEPEPETPSSMVISNNNSNYELVLESPRSQNSPISKKRKRTPREMKRVRVGGSVSGLEGPLDDGFSWRKYGQKIILGAQFPRGYYRCTHRHSKGCAATKQVQRSDEDPSIYEIIYSGDHTCIQGSQIGKAQSKPKPAQIKNEVQPQPAQTPHEQSQIIQSLQQEVFLDLGPNGELKVAELDCENKAHFFRSFSFSSLLVETGPFDDMLSYSPGFRSPATSESNYFPASPNGIFGSGGGLNVHLSDSDLNDAMSAPNSVTNSPKVGDFEFLLDPLLDIDVNFPFEF